MKQKMAGRRAGLCNDSEADPRTDRKLVKATFKRLGNSLVEIEALRAEAGALEAKKAAQDVLIAKLEAEIAQLNALSGPAANVLPL